MFGSSGPKSFSNLSGTQPLPVLQSPPAIFGSTASNSLQPPRPLFGTELSFPVTASAEPSRNSTNSANPFSQHAFESSSSGVQPKSISSPGWFNKSTNESRPFISKESAKSGSTITQDAKGRFHGPNVCRMCGNQFSNADELKKHIKLENHYDTATLSNNSLSSGAFTSDAVAKPSSGDTSLLASGAQSKFQSQVDDKHAIATSKTSTSTFSNIISGIKQQPIEKSSIFGAVVKPPSSLDQILTAPSSIANESRIEVSEREKKLKELLRSKREKTDSLPISTQNETVAPINTLPNPVVGSLTSLKPLEKQVPPKQTVMSATNSSDPADFDRGRRPEGRATCEDMCPEEERIRRTTEYGALHELERPNPDFPEFATSQQTMIKRFQKSAADHELNIPELVRTPRALLKTIIYIEENLMDLFEDYEQEESPPIVVYLFIWDRYRMIAKDFTLMNPALGVNVIWIECHERMARWYVYMDHRMKCEEDYVKAGHGQQNGESLNNIFKTLFTFYSLAEQCNDGGPLYTPNKGELVGYFIIFQIGNKGEMTKFLQQLKSEYFDSEDVQFAINVWRAVKLDNYSAFFKLLQSATLLQACMMHKYVSEVRVMALKKMCKSYATPGSMGTPCYYSLNKLSELLMFEDIEEAREFVDHCGFEVEEEDHEEGPCILLENQNFYNSLKVDKNNNPILPVARYMWNGIESKRLKEQESSESDANSSPTPVSLKDICRGALSAAAVRFQDDICLKQKTPPPSFGQAQTQKVIAKSSVGVTSTTMGDDDDDDYELSSQDSDDDAAVAPFSLLPGKHKQVTSPPPPPSMKKTISSLTPKKESASQDRWDSATTFKQSDANLKSAVVEPKGSSFETPVKALNVSLPINDTPPSKPFTFQTPLKLPSTNDNDVLKQKEDEAKKALIEAQQLKERQRKIKEEQEALQREKEAQEKDALEKQKRIEEEKKRLEQERIKKELEKEALRKQEESLRAIQEQKRLEEIERKASIERSREASLENLLQKYMKSSRISIQRKSFKMWRVYSMHSSAKMKAALQRLYFGRWTTALTLCQRRRNNFIADINSINVSLPSFSRESPIKPTSKKRKLSSVDYSFTSRDRKDVHSRVELDFNTVSVSLTDALKILIEEGCAQNLDSNFDQYLPVNVPSRIGKVLFDQQSRKVKKYFENSIYESIESNKSKDIWENSLFFKMAFISTCSSSGQWNRLDDVVQNVMRLLLCTHQSNQLDYKGIIGRWREIIHVGSENDFNTRTLNVSITDICQDHLNFNPHPALCSQFVIVTLSLCDQSNWARLTSELSILIRKRCPIVVVFSKVNTLESSIILDDIRGDSNNESFRCKVLMDDFLYKDLLQKFCIAINVNLDELLNCMVGMFTITSEPGSTNDQQLSKLLVLCRKCLESSFEQLCNELYEANISFPLIQKFSASDWIRESLSRIVWSNGHNAKEYLTTNGEIKFFDSLVNKIEYCVGASEELIFQSKYRCASFPAYDFTLEDTKKSDSLVSGALFQNLSSDYYSNSIRWDWNNDENYLKSINSLASCLKLLRNIFQSNRLCECLEIVKTRLPKLEIPKKLDSLRSCQLFVQRIIDYVIENLENIDVIYALPENASANENPFIIALRSVTTSLDESVDTTICHEQAYTKSSFQLIKADNLSENNFSPDIYGSNIATMICKKPLDLDRIVQESCYEDIFYFNSIVSRELLEGDIFIKKLSKLVAQGDPDSILDDDSRSINSNSDIMAEENVPASVNSLLKLVEESKRERQETDRWLKQYI